MTIGGIQKNTLIDYPGKIATTVFTLGCDFLCPFCYASELVSPKKIECHPRISETDFFDFLKNRQDLLDGVCICGGEPTIHSDLEEFIRKIKNFGFAVKLDTNGYLPDILEDLMRKQLLDYVAMDIKAPPEKYQQYCGIKIDISRIQESIEILRSGNIGYEFRTTLAPGLTKNDLINIADWIEPAEKYFLQEFTNNKNIMDEKILTLPIIDYRGIREAIKEIKSFFTICKLR